MYWLRFEDLFGETEDFVSIVQIADKVIKINNYRKNIPKNGTVDIYEACRRPVESLRHIISRYLANGEYFHMHNLVARVIHKQLALLYIRHCGVRSALI